MKKIGFAGLVALGACGSPEPAALKAPERTVTAEEVYQTFATNEVAAKRDFEKTPITITGETVLVSEESVMFRTPDGASLGLQMLPGNTDALADLKMGQTFSADCEGAVKVQHVVAMQRCRPSKSPPPAS